MTDFSFLFQHVSFAYEGATQPLFNDLSLHLTRGWTGIVGANGVGKSTILKLATGILKPQKGRIDHARVGMYCEQRTDSAPAGFSDFLLTNDGEALRTKDHLRIGDDWGDRWATLSHGERKRAQIGVALWRDPQVLALDEPTNHLDLEAQNLLHQSLSGYRGVGILVSHDRNLLDGLCHQCLFVEPPDAILRPGNYSKGLEQAQRDRLTSLRLRDEARQNYERLRRESNKRREAAQQADRKRSKRGLGRGDHDARGKIDLARATGKDGVAGKLLRQLEGRLVQAQSRIEGITVKKAYTLGIWMPGARSRRNTLFQFPGGSLCLGEGRRLDFPELVMKPDDRVAFAGPNGSGKSTLVAQIVKSLTLEPGRLTYIPQEIDIRASREILQRARDLPGATLGHMMTIVSRLGSTPRRLLETQEPSPGEIRKILLAIGIALEPHLIIMDEPTNHLDLPSIECLEQALAECPCGLLLVSHDRRFLDALSSVRWNISETSSEKGSYTLKTQ